MRSRDAAADDYGEQFGRNPLLDDLVEDGAVFNELLDDRDDLLAVVRPVSLFKAQGQLFGAFLQQKFLHRVFVAEVLFPFAALDLVERRLGDIEVAAFDQFPHVAVEERQQQRR